MVYLTKRQKEVYDFLIGFIRRYGYAPSIKEICDNFGSLSIAAMQKHLINLHQKGLIKRDPNKSRAIELIEDKPKDENQFEIQVTGYVSNNVPLQTFGEIKFVKIPEEMASKRYTYIFVVKGNYLANEGILDGDYVVLESREKAENGDIAAVLINKEYVTLRKILTIKDHIMLQSTNPKETPTIVEGDNYRIQGVVIGVIRNYKRKSDEIKVLTPGIHILE